MVKIAFHADELGLNGATTALYDYALYNEALLLNQSLMLVPRNGRHDPRAMKRFRSRFLTLYYETAEERDRTIESERCAALYCIKAGHDDGVVARSARTLVHCTSTLAEPHGDVYAAVSESLVRRAAKTHPHVPPIVCPPDVRTDLREALGIPRDAIVFGRHGAPDTFDLPYAKDAVLGIVRRRPDVYFVFLNTKAFCEHDQIKFIPGTSDPVYRAEFINTCDAMLHARSHGEDLALACAEFSAQNRPVITCAHGARQGHLDMLGDRALPYRDAHELEAALDGFQPDPGRDWDVCSTRLNPFYVIRQFERVFLEPLGLVEPRDRSRVIFSDLGSRKYWLLGNDVASRRIASGMDPAPQVTECLKHVLRAGDHVADVGAGVGLHTLTASACVGSSGRVLAFEPQRELFQLLRDNCRDNGALNVRLFLLAMAHDRGETRLSSLDYAARDIDCGDVHMAAHDASGEIVRVGLLDDVATRQPLRLIRIDVAGAEVLVLQGAARRIMADRPLLQINIDERRVSRFHYTAEELQQLLCTLQYAVLLLGALGSTDHLCVPLEQLRDFENSLGRFVRSRASANFSALSTHAGSTDVVERIAFD